MQKELPKILYYADVPVELSSAGPTLLYRLLEYYPKDRLLIIQGVNVDKNRPRIPGVEYHISKSPLERLRDTRFSKYLKGPLLFTEWFGLTKTKRIINSFKPDIVLTVSFRLMWVNAYRFSKRLGLPLYLILHDDWLTTENYGRWQPSLERIFEKMYRHAKEKFCISPTMEAYYDAMYGVNAKVIFPLRGKNDLLLPVSSQKKDKSKSLKFCYAGSLFPGDFAPMLDKIAQHIEKENGELHIFSYPTKGLLEKYEHLKKNHVVFHTFMHSTALMQKMNKEMDVAVLLNSYIHEESFRYNFSSKLVDYVSAGLPVIFWGPQSSGSTAWVISHGYNAVVTEQDPAYIANLIDAFSNEEQRIKWAKQIRALGEDYFSYEKNYATFINSL